jgi:predicted transcriptional regulator
MCRNIKIKVIMRLIMAYHKWTKEKELLLMEYYPAANWDTIFEQLEYDNKQNIMAKAKILGIKREKLIWTKEKEDILIELYPMTPWNILLEKLNMENADAVAAKAYKMGIKRLINENCGGRNKEGKDYTEYEVQFIVDNFEKMTYPEIAKTLNRGLSSISNKINDLGLRKIIKWTEDELNILKETFPKYSSKYININYLPNKSSSAIYNMAKDLSIDSNKREKKAYKKYDDDEILEQLRILAEKLNRTPIHADLIPNGLPSISTFRIYFESYTHACVLAGLIPNFSRIGVGRRGVFYSKNKDMCFSNSEVIVTNFLIDNKIPYKKEQYYSSYIKDDRCKTKEVDWIIGENVFVEFFGFPKDDIYYQRMLLKRSICEDNNIKLIEIYKEDLGKLHIIFKNFIENP